MSPPPPCVLLRKTYQLDTLIRGFKNRSLVQESLKMGSIPPNMVIVRG